MNNENDFPCGIAIPQVFIDEPIDINLVESFSIKAEELGYHSLWVQEKIIGSIDTLEPVNLLTYVAAFTSEIKLGTAVLIGTTRNPILLAKELATLDHLSSGRLILGYALGGSPRNYHMLGGPSSRRVKHFIESLDVIKQLWCSDSPSYEGVYWDFENLPFHPKPVQEPRPPIWFGGRHPDSLRRAVRHGDGWMGAGSTSTSQFVNHVKIIENEINIQRIESSEFTISKRVYVAIDDDEERAENRLRRWFEGNYGNSDMAVNVSVWGSPEKVIEDLQKVIDAGAQMLMLNPVFDHMWHLSMLREEVIPHLRRIG